MASAIRKLGFTLVELIVVITILAILATIAFLSFSGYSGSARDSKRASDLASITRKIGVSDLQGAPMLAFVSGNGGRITPAPSYAGLTAVPGSDYEAGHVNYTALQLKDSDFADPDGDKYKMGITIVAGSYYQLAATLESEGTPKALVIGNFKRRTTAASTVTSLGVAGKTFNIGNSDIGKLRRGDNLGGVYGKVVNISSAGKIITVDGTPPGNAVTVGLASDETDGLIATIGDATKPVLQDATGSGNLPY